MLKGKTIIELTDTKTGNVETLEDTNMVTNAIHHLFSDNLAGMAWYVRYVGVNWENQLVPVCPNAIGGILLFSEPLEENAENLYAPSTNPCVGYASNDVNTGGNTLRGSLNQTESGRIENGYKFVWDFATSQGNGSISAVALTNKLGGQSYVGDEFSKAGYYCMKPMGKSMPPSDSLYCWRYYSCVEIDFVNNIQYSIALNKDGQVVILKMRRSFRTLYLNDTLLEDGTEEILEEITLTPTTDFIKPSGYSTSYWAFYTFLDGKDGYWYGFTNHSMNGNSAGDATIRWIKIAKSDYSFTEGTWTLSNVQIGQIGQMTGYEQSSSLTHTYTTIRNGYWYVFNFAKNGLYKINLHNPADVTFIPLGFVSADPKPYGSGQLTLFTWRDFIIGSDFHLDTEDTIHPTFFQIMPNNVCTPLFECGVYAIAYGCYFSTSGTASRSVYKNIYLMTPYLASINNLPSAVTKTADKTMKITYILTETPPAPPPETESSE